MPDTRTTVAGRTSAVVAVVWLFVASTIAGQTSDIFLLRSHGDEQGIVSINPETKAEARVADFLYVGGMNGPCGGFGLAAKPGVVIAQSRSFYEFDESSGQLTSRWIRLTGTGRVEKGLG